MNANGTLERARNEADPLERVRMVLAAHARGDEHEVATLWRTAPRLNYRAPDERFAEPAQAILGTISVIAPLAWTLTLERDLAEGAAATARLAAILPDSAFNGALQVVKALRDAGHLTVPEDELEDLDKLFGTAATEHVERSEQIAEAWTARAEEAERRLAGLWAGVDAFADRLGVQHEVMSRLLERADRPIDTSEPDPETRSAVLDMLTRAAGDLLP